MCTATELVISKTWKQSRCPSAGERTHKYLQTTECFSALKRNALSSDDETRRTLHCESLRERQQFKKARFCTISTVWHSRKGKTMETVKGQWSPGVGGGRGQDRNKQGPEDFRGSETPQHDILMDGCVSLYLCLNPRTAQHHEWRLREL